MALVVAAAWIVMASPAPAASVSHSPTAIRAYWTKARMRHATPMPIVRVDPGSAASGASGESAGQPLAIEPAQPRASAASSSLHREVPRTRRFPNRTHGKVFMTLNGIDYVCSGTAVKAPSHSLVNTAGHCLYETPPPLLNGYATNWEFVPGYKNGHRPFGEWPAPRNHLRTTQQYVDSMPLVLGEGGDERYDLGFATVAQPNGKSLQDVIGARGIAFNQPRSQGYRAYGYPAESPPPEFDGEHLFRCDSSYRGADDAFGGPPKPMRILCDMTGGSSGGGWVIQRGYVASVNAYGYNGEPNKLYGPYFGTTAQSLYNSVKNG